MFENYFELLQLWYREVVRCSNNILLPNFILLVNKIENNKRNLFAAHN